MSVTVDKNSNTEGDGILPTGDSGESGGREERESYIGGEDKERSVDNGRGEEKNRG